MACSGVFGVPDTTRTCDPGLGGSCSIQLSYWDIYQKYSIFLRPRIRTNCRLGGDRSIQLSYGGLYRKYSLLQGSRIRTIRFLGGGRSIQLSYKDMGKIDARRRRPCSAGAADAAGPTGSPEQIYFTTPEGTLSISVLKNARPQAPEIPSARPRKLWAGVKKAVPLRFRKRRALRLFV